MFQLGLSSRRVALVLVCITCVFITLLVAISAGTLKNYDTPSPVRSCPILFYSVLTVDAARVSFGAGSALSSQENALVANTSGCGSH